MAGAVRQLSGQLLCCLGEFAAQGLHLFFDSLLELQRVILAADTDHQHLAHSAHIRNLLAQALDRNLAAFERF